MSYTPNPYAPPAAPIAPPPTFQAGGPGPWQIGETLSASWRAFTTAWAPLVFAPILVGLALSVPIFVILGIWIGPEIGNGRGIAIVLQDPTLNASLLGFQVVVVPAYAFLQAGIVKMRMCAVRNEAVQFGDLFSGGPHFLSMLGVHVLVSGPGLLMNGLGLVGRFAGSMALVNISSLLANVVVFALLVLQALGLVFAEYFVVDRGQGTIDALKSAMALPGGDRGSVLGYFIVVGLIAVGGLMCCAFPGLVTMPYAGVCAAMLFTRLAPPKW
jgi:hypothetical protein